MSRLAPFLVLAVLVGASNAAGSRDAAHRRCPQGGDDRRASDARHPDVDGDAEVARQQLDQVGFNVDLQVLDWATLNSRALKPELWDVASTGLVFTALHPQKEELMDRYTRIVLTVIAVALVVIAVRPLVPSLLESVRPEIAQAQQVTPKYDVAVPKSWGKFVAFSNNNLLLESPEGWRIVDVEGKMPEYPKVKALIRWQ